MPTAVLKELLKRRVPQILGIYLGISWAIVEAVGFLVDRYLLSTYLVDLCIVILISLIPSVLILAYFHGAPGRDEWTLPEKVGIPMNLLVCAALVAFLFSGKDLGAATMTVSVEDEEGQTVERVIPKSEFRKKVVLFPFENTSGDSALDWLQYGMPLGVWDDLRQDMFVSATDGLRSREQMTEAGYADGLGMPLSLMRSIATDAHVDRFATGSIGGSYGEVSVTMVLHDARRGKPIDERTFSGTDIFELIDSISVQLKRGLEVPDRHLEEVEDLPFSEIQTNSLAAYQAAVAGYTAVVLHSDWGTAATLFEQAVAEDPTYAGAQHSLFQVYAYSNRVQEGIAPMQAALQHLYRLPEREQFEVKSDYYFTRQDYDKAMAVFAMRVELYPDDVEGHAALAQLLLVQDKKDEAVEQYVKILEIDPEQYDLLRQIGGVYESQGKFEEALEYYEAYAEQFPDERVSFTAIGDLHSNIGNHEQAREYQEKALLIDPNDVGVMARLARIEWDLGHFERAIAQLDEALAVARTPEDLTTVYEGLRAYYESRGQLEEAIEYVQLAQEQRRQYRPPLASIMTQFQSLGIHVAAGHADRAYETLEAVRAELAPPWDAFVPLGELFLYLELEEPDSVERALEGVESLIQTFSYNMFMPLVFHARGRIHEMRGEYEEAIRAYERDLELNPSDESIYEEIGRCYRGMGDLDEAQKQLLKTLTVRPYSATAHYEIALVFSEMGDTDRVLEHLGIALDVWSDADPAFQPAQRARDKLEELRSAG
ncbi:MAG: tetratricopeptide repeat protein [Gemmatimonadota bacterium]|nr:MAG: tetratricopeptide repeat protein [Gemmatimonadota bacterium]